MNVITKFAAVFALAAVAFLGQLAVLQIVAAPLASALAAVCSRERSNSCSPPVGQYHARSQGNSRKPESKPPNEPIPPCSEAVGSQGCEGPDC